MLADEDSTIPKNEQQVLTSGTNLGWAVDKALDEWIKKKVIAQSIDMQCPIQGV